MMRSDWGSLFSLAPITSATQSLQTGLVGIPALAGGYQMIDLHISRTPAFTAPTAIGRQRLGVTSTGRRMRHPPSEIRNRIPEICSPVPEKPHRLLRILRIGSGPRTKLTPEVERLILDILRSYGTIETVFACIKTLTHTLCMAQT